MRKQWGVVIDLRKCTGCLACKVGCEQIHQLAAGESWIEVLSVGPAGVFPKVSMYWLPVMCMHCRSAPCLADCGGGAISRRQDGIVVLDRDACQGCEACVVACPYQVISFDPARQVAAKCNLCFDRIEGGESPYCAQTCTAGAIYFGDLANPQSEVARWVRAKEARPLLPDLNADPLVCYIGPTIGYKGA